MKARGFVRHGHNWNRAAGDLRDVVNVQGGAWNQGDWGQFAVNLGKFPSSVYSVSVGVEPPPVVAEFHCPLRTRVGALMPRLDQDQPVDRWWRFDVSSDAQAIGEEVADAILTYGLPFLESVHSLVSIRRILRSHRSRQLPPFSRTSISPLSRRHSAHCRGDDTLGRAVRGHRSQPACTRSELPSVLASC